MPRRDPAKAIAVLDAMLKFFDGGRRWTRGELEEGRKPLPRRRASQGLPHRPLFSHWRCQPSLQSIVAISTLTIWP